MSPRSLSPLSDSGRSEAEEKVTKNALSNKNTNVDPSARPSSSSRLSRYDRSDRKYAVMFNPRAHFDDYRPDGSRSPYRNDRDRSRSRSPYRASKEKDKVEDTVGQKRRREDDQYGKSASDTRRHKVYQDPPGRGQASNYHRGSDRVSHPSGRPHNNDRDGRGRGNMRNSYGDRDRDRSRSPYRAPADNTSRPGSRQEQDVSNDSRSKRRGSTPSAQREFTPQAPRDRADTKMSSSQSEQEAAASQNVGKASDQLEEAEPEKQLSEAELIEQRRKKREAIRKKHAASSIGDSLLRATLEANQASAVVTPQHESVTGSREQSPPSPSSVGSPSTPRDSTSAPTSPAEFATMKDVDLANPLQVNATMDDQGQSAADYDPNQDMDEDRPEFKQQHVQESLPQEETTVAAPPKKSADDFDMFADDDDDMFAANEAPIHQAGGKQARALDESLHDNWDYPDGHYRIINGELLNGRYAVEQQVGKGTFATVVRATDTNTGTKVAIKIACRNDTMLKAGQKEMQFLERLNERDPEDKRYIIRLLGNFTHKGHLCLVFEGLHMDLREVLKKFGRDVGINLEAVKLYAYQMFHALQHMKNAEVLHADLKPDNILVNEKRTLIKVCDFGTATLQQDAELTPYLVSRFYRAPEVILGMDFDYAIDMWAIGCTLYELYAGRILFNGSDNNNMLRVIQECRGKLPNRLIKRAKLADKYFDDAFTFHGLDRDKMTGNVIHRPMHFAQGLVGKDLKSRLGGNLNKMDAVQLKEHNVFVDLLDKCLQLDPEKRIKPKDALHHQFFARPLQAKPKTSASTTPFRPVSAKNAG
ncbi:hypothetical protein M409DRAFT_24013 [Zasmidium cellare ATCC 36951]|uniref:non-specific serine/threonine protein kinase n=1 Tax=Zasmidium cellare ATCC 36951 TaxID=1080233 RepID=A0A6A6CF23_ZASCE|nr:uncharacterized protein M409DRAFT_24013 [Zasmidium cellare ATCC 36951]KAF2165725.1 hypothetical protein M409DRAFT_24013 [Zasmidium cellare ATCC 36951]